MEENKLLFSDIKFIIAQCYQTDHIKNVLIEGGAKHINYLSEHVTLVISDTNCSEAEEAVELFDKPVVTSLWVHLSIKASKLLPTEAFSPIKTIFNNVVASFSSSISTNDISILASTLTYYGARVTKDVASSTHFIVAKPNTSDLPDRSSSNHNLKVVAPDWIIESVKSKRCCDETLFDPELLLPTPPPPPPTPPPQPQPIVQDATKPQDIEKEALVKPPKPDPTPIENKVRLDNLQQTQQPSQLQQQRVRLQQPSPQIQNHQQQYPQHAQSQPAQQIQTMPSHLPRHQGVTQNILRGVQPKFRPLIPPNNNVPLATSAQQQQPRGALPDSQQPKKVTMNFNQYRKSGPYQNNLDPQQQQQQTQAQQTPTYNQVQTQPPSHPHTNIQPQPGTNAQQSRLPQPTMYNQVRGTYQISHIPPRGQPTQQQMVSSQQQPNQMINRFQDPNTPINQRPYQVCLQPQTVKPNYQPNNIPRPIYYTQQGNNQVQLRMPQQGPPVRHIQNEQVVYENFNPSQHSQEPMQHYQSHPNQSFQHTIQQPPPHQQFQTTQHQHHPHGQMQVRGQLQQQVQPPTMPQNQPPITNQAPGLQNRPAFPPNFFRGGPGPQHIRTARAPFISQQQPIRVPSIRHTNPEQMTNQQSLRMSESSQTQIQPQNQSQSHLQPHPQVYAQHQVRPKTQPQPQPHPSIFDHRQELNLAQIKAKVPVVAESFDYFGHDSKETVPKDLPLSGCLFQIVEYEEIKREMRQKWLDAIKAAGGAFSEKLDEVTHLICETRLSSKYRESIDLGIRCVTIYWINDVLAQNRLTYPWKALHLPTPYSRDNRPLTNQIISVTNLKGRERREVKEMIIKTGAMYTDYFSARNTLLICGNVGGDKYEHAIDWKIPVVNCQLLSDILLNSDKSLEAMLSQHKYNLFNHNDPLRLTSYLAIQDLMLAWKRPIAITEKRDDTSKISSNGGVKEPGPSTNSKDDSGVATGSSNNSDLDINGKSESNPLISIPNGPLKTEAEPKNEDMVSSSEGAGLMHTDTKPNSEMREDTLLEVPKDGLPVSSNVDSSKLEDNLNLSADALIVNKKEIDHNVDELGLDQTIATTESVANGENGSIEPTKNLRKSNEPVRLLFTRLESNLVSQLQSFALKLGLSVANGPTNCTHLIVDSISRTPKFICAFSHANYIMSYKWIIESHKAGSLLDEKQFILQDASGEEKYSFNLIYSMLKRKRRGKPLFSHLVFFVTPQVLANVSSIREMIESAGGVVETKKPPSRLQIAQMKLEGKRFVIVSCNEDRHLCLPFESIGVNIVDVEFVISGILRQDIDFEAHRLKKISESPFIRPETTPIAQISQPSPPKKLRLEEHTS